VFYLPLLPRERPFASPPFLATRSRVALLAEANPLDEAPFDAVPLDEALFEEAPFEEAPFEELREADAPRVLLEAEADLEDDLEAVADLADPFFEVEERDEAPLLADLDRLLPEDLLADDFEAALLLPPPDDLLAPFFGTFSPDSRASERPMAIACFLDFTVLPLRPLFS
jgi:hypothetical protein